MRTPSRGVLIITAIVVVAIVVMALVGASTLFMIRHVAIEPGTDESAGAEFEKARQRFAGQRPLIDIEPDGTIRNRLNEHEGKAPTKPNMLHVLAWDSNRGRLVRADIPFWALRLKSSLPGMRTEVPVWVLLLPDNPDATRMRSDSPRLRLEDLERFGPGLLLDHEIPGGRRVLMWAQ